MKLMTNRNGYTGVWWYVIYVMSLNMGNLGPIDGKILTEWWETISRAYFMAPPGWCKMTPAMAGQWDGLWLASPYPISRNNLDFIGVGDSLHCVDCTSTFLLWGYDHSRDSPKPIQLHFWTNTLQNSWYAQLDSIYIYIPRQSKIPPFHLKKVEISVEYTKVACSDSSWILLNIHQVCLETGIPKPCESTISPYVNVAIRGLHVQIDPRSSYPSITPRLFLFHQIALYTLW